MQRTKVEIQMRRYLLGQLPGEERAVIEEKYLSTAEDFDELLAVEYDLIDSYVRGELAEEERRSFESEYLASQECRLKVEFARSLSQLSAGAGDAAQDRKLSPWKGLRTVFATELAFPQWALGVAVLAVLLAGSWLLVQNQGLRVEVQRALADQAKLRRDEAALRQQVAQLEGIATDKLLENQSTSVVAKVEAPIAPVATLRLKPGMARDTGGALNLIRLSKTASFLRLQLVLEQDEYTAYEATLMTPERKVAARSKTLESRPDDNAVVLWDLPARSVLSGDYIVQLQGRLANGSTENVASYSFRVLRK